MPRSTLKFEASEIAAALGTAADGEVLVLHFDGYLFDGATHIIGDDVIVLRLRCGPGKASVAPLDHGASLLIAKSSTVVDCMHLLRIPVHLDEARNGAPMSALR